MSDDSIINSLIHYEHTNKSRSIIQDQRHYSDSFKFGHFDPTYKYTPTQSHTCTHTNTNTYINTDICMHHKYKYEHVFTFVG